MKTVTPGRRELYPWRTLRVGEAFIVIAEGDRQIAQRRASLYTLAKPHGYKVSIKQVPGGLRVERVA